MSPAEKLECAGYLMLREKDSVIAEPVLRAACYGDAVWDFEDKSFCLMHAPVKEKSSLFKDVLLERLAAKAYNFRGVWFPGKTDLRGHNFETDANFAFAEFSDRADFYEAQFGGAAVFESANFNKGANFSSAQFARGAEFKWANFASQTSFYQALFKYYSDFGDAKFNGVVDFIGAEFDKPVFFHGVKFEGGDIWFVSAKFRDAVSFLHAEFNGGEVTFESATFDGPDHKVDWAGFVNARFKHPVSFRSAVFETSAKFKDAVFESRVTFDNTQFHSDASFLSARFANYARFVGVKIKDGVDLSFFDAMFEQPERVIFFGISNLQPYWFLNADVKKVGFDNVAFPSLRKINLVTTDIANTRNLLQSEQGYQGLRPDFVEKQKDLVQILKAYLETRRKPYRLLSATYGRLAVNAEENNRYEDAKSFRYLSMDTLRRERVFRRFFPFNLYWWYWASSGYGERVLRASIMLFLVWFIPYTFYKSSSAEFPQKQAVSEITTDMAEPKIIPNGPISNRVDAAFYSLNVMSFQKPEPKPAENSTLTRSVVILQTILGPVQAALLLLAIRRKFMR